MKIRVKRVALEQLRRHFSLIAFVRAIGFVFGVAMMISVSPALVFMLKPTDWLAEIHRIQASDTTVGGLQEFVWEGHITTPTRASIDRELIATDNGKVMENRRYHRRLPQTDGKLWSQQPAPPVCKDGEYKFVFYIELRNSDFPNIVRSLPAIETNAFHISCLDR